MENSHKCSHCDTVFSGKKYLVRHIKTHTEEKQYQCSQCDKGFQSNAHLIIHIRKHTGEKPYKCILCSKAFSQKGSLKTHMKIHTGENSHTCSHCDKVFSRKIYLVRHIKTHTGEKPYRCSQCDKGFQSNAHLITHTRKHTSEKPYICRLCSKAFSHNQSLRSHMEIHTGEMQPKPYRCNQCDKGFLNNEHLSVHIRKHTGEKPYKCGLCSKAFSQDIYLKNHMKTHTGEKPFKCKVCGKAFLLKITLIYHLRIHTGEKPYKCSFCVKAFSQISQVNRHQKTHTGERNYKCSHCDKAYTRNIDLVYHMRKHKEKKSFQCSQCNKAFLYKVGLVAHIRTHSKEKPFHCSHCDKAYVNKTQIIAHLKTHSDENQNKSKLLRHRHEENMQPKKPFKHTKKVNILQNAVVKIDIHNDKDDHQLNNTKNEIFKTGNENKGDILVTKTNDCTKIINNTRMIHIKSSNNYTNIVTQCGVKINENADLNKKIYIKGSGKIKEPPKYTYKNGKRCMIKDGEEQTDNGEMIQFGSLKNEIVVPQHEVTIKKKSGLKENFDITCSERINEHPNSTYKHKKVEKCMMKESEEQTENVVMIQSSSFKYEEIILSDSDENEEIIISDLDNECEIGKSEPFLKENDTVENSKAMQYILCAIDKAFDWLEESTEGLWKRTPNQIEQDLYDVLQLHKLERFKNKLYSNIYNLDVNYRQLYLTFSGVDSMVLKHALLCKNKYPKCEDIPHKHQEDMNCCI